jgi:hypothetical protein
MPVQLDIVGNLAKGAALREGIQRAGEERQARQLTNEGRRLSLTNQMGGALPDNISRLYDPYEFKLGQMFQGLFDSDARRERRGQRALGDQGYATTNVAMMAPGVDRMQQAQEMTQDPMRYADGGEVEDEEFHPVREFASALGGRAAEAVAPRNVIPNYLRESARTDERVSGAVEGWGDANARQRGAMARNAVVEGGVGAYRQVGGFLQDVTRPLAPVYEGVMGALGFTGEAQAEETGPAGKSAAKPSATPEQAAAAQEQAPAEEPVPTESPSSGAGAATPRTALSQQFVGTPDPEQGAARLGNIDLMPEEMPTMGTRDWIAFREQEVPALMMQGMTAEEAHKSVSAMQHEGFMRYAQQGAMMLQANNLKGAARALKAAYQYFPNGADVKFGFQNGHLVGVGLNEETGEPMGKPQVITPEYLAAMVTNFQDPAKYLQWTKDWRDEIFRDRQYTEVTKPDAQSTLDYRNRSLDIADRNAATNEASAQAQLQRAAASAGGDGPSETDYMAADKVFEEAIFAAGVEDQAEIDQLKSIMSQIRTTAAWKDLPNPTIANKIMEAHRNGTLPQVLQRLGIK